MPIVSDKLHDHMIKLFNLPPHAIGYTIRMKRNTLVEIDVTYYPDFTWEPDKEIEKTYILSEIDEENTNNHKNKT